MLAYAQAQQTVSCGPSAGGIMDLHKACKHIMVEGLTRKEVEE